MNTHRGIKCKQQNHAQNQKNVHNNKNNITRAELFKSAFLQIAWSFGFTFSPGPELAFFMCAA